LTSNQPVSPLAIIIIALGIISIITRSFVNRQYQNKFLYFSIIPIIVAIVLIFTYFQTSTPSYKGNTISDYGLVGIFVLVTSLLVYMSFREMKNYQKAIAIYDDALKINPKDTTALNNKGTALISLNKYQEAIKCFEKALEIDPKDASVLHNKGVNLEKLGKHQDAIKYYDRALELDPQFEGAKKSGKFILEN